MMVWWQSVLSWTIVLTDIGLTACVIGFVYDWVDTRKNLRNKNCISLEDLIDTLKKKGVLK